jgi:hypothetical protein
MTLWSAGPSVAYAEEGSVAIPPTGIIKAINGPKPNQPFVFDDF